MSFLGRINLVSIKVLESVHEVSFFMFIPLFFLCIASIFFGYLFRDLFIGFGSDFWVSSLNFSSYDFLTLKSEFLYSYIKLLPFLFSVCGGIFSLVFYFFSVLFYNNYFVFIFFSFFNRKWYFDMLYNNIFLYYIFEYSYVITFKFLDRGFIELYGSTGIIRFVRVFVLFFSRLLNTGSLYNYSFFGFLFLVIFMFCFFFNIFFFDLFYFYLLVIILVLFVFFRVFLVFFFIEVFLFCINNPFATTSQDYYYKYEGNDQVCMFLPPVVFDVYPNTWRCSKKQYLSGLHVERYLSGLDYRLKDSNLSLKVEKVRFGDGVFNVARTRYRMHGVFSIPSKGFFGYFYLLYSFTGKEEFWYIRYPTVESRSFSFVLRRQVYEAEQELKEIIHKLNLYKRTRMLRSKRHIRFGQYRVFVHRFFHKIYDWRLSPDPISLQYSSVKVIRPLWRIEKWFFRVSHYLIDFFYRFFLRFVVKIRFRIVIDEHYRSEYNFRFHSHLRILIYNYLFQAYSNIVSSKWFNFNDKANFRLFLRLRNFFKNPIIRLRIEYNNFKGFIRGFRYVDFYKWKNKVFFRIKKNYWHLFFRIKNRIDSSKCSVCSSICYFIYLFFLKISKFFRFIFNLKIFCDFRSRFFFFFRQFCYFIFYFFYKWFFLRFLWKFFASLFSFFYQLRYGSYSIFKRRKLIDFTIYELKMRELYLKQFINDVREHDRYLRWKLLHNIPLTRGDICTSVVHVKLSFWRRFLRFIYFYGMNLHHVLLGLVLKFLKLLKYQYSYRIPRFYHRIRFFLVFKTRLYDMFWEFFNEFFDDDPLDNEMFNIEWPQYWKSDYAVEEGEAGVFWFGYEFTHAFNYYFSKLIDVRSFSFFYHEIFVKYLKRVYLYSKEVEKDYISCRLSVIDSLSYFGCFIYYLYEFLLSISYLILHFHIVCIYIIPFLDKLLCFFIDNQNLITLEHIGLGPFFWGLFIYFYMLFVMYWTFNKFREEVNKPAIAQFPILNEEDDVTSDFLSMAESFDSLREDIDELVDETGPLWKDWFDQEEDEDELVEMQMITGFLRNEMFTLDLCLGSEIRLKRKIRKNTIAYGRLIPRDKSDIYMHHGFFHVVHLVDYKRSQGIDIIDRMFLLYYPILYAFWYHYLDKKNFDAFFNYTGRLENYGPNYKYKRHYSIGDLIYVPYNEEYAAGLFNYSASVLKAGFETDLEEDEFPPEAIDIILDRSYYIDDQYQRVVTLLLNDTSKSFVDAFLSSYVNNLYLYTFLQANKRFMNPNPYSFEFFINHIFYSINMFTSDDVWSTVGGEVFSGHYYYGKYLDFLDKALLSNIRDEIVKAHYVFSSHKGNKDWLLFLDSASQKRRRKGDPFSFDLLSYYDFIVNKRHREYISFESFMALLEDAYQAHILFIDYDLTSGYRGLGDIFNDSEALSELVGELSSKLHVNLFKYFHPFFDYVFFLNRLHDYPHNLYDYTTLSYHMDFYSPYIFYEGCFFTAYPFGDLYAFDPVRYYIHNSDWMYSLYDFFITSNLYGRLFNIVLKDFFSGRSLNVETYDACRFFIRNFLYYYLLNSRGRAGRFEFFPDLYYNHPVFHFFKSKDDFYLINVYCMFPHWRRFLQFKVFGDYGLHNKLGDKKINSFPTVPQIIDRNLVFYKREFFDFEGRLWRVSKGSVANVGRTALFSKKNTGSTRYEGRHYLIGTSHGDELPKDFRTMWFDYASKKLIPLNDFRFIWASLDDDAKRHAVSHMHNMNYLYRKIIHKHKRNIIAYPDVNTFEFLWLKQRSRFFRRMYPDFKYEWSETLIGRKEPWLKDLTTGRTLDLDVYRPFYYSKDIWFRRIGDISSIVDDQFLFPSAPGGNFYDPSNRSSKGAISPSFRELSAKTYSHHNQESILFKRLTENRDFGVGHLSRFTDSLFNDVYIPHFLNVILDHYDPINFDINYGGTRTVRFFLDNYDSFSSKYYEDGFSILSDMSSAAHTEALYDIVYIDCYNEAYNFIHYMLEIVSTMIVC